MTEAILRPTGSWSRSGRRGRGGRPGGIGACQGQHRARGRAAGFLSAAGRRRGPQHGSFIRVHQRGGANARGSRRTHRSAIRGRLPRLRPARRSAGAPEGTRRGRRGASTWPRQDRVGEQRRQCPILDTGGFSLPGLRRDADRDEADRGARGAPGRPRSRVARSSVLLLMLPPLPPGGAADRPPQRT